MTSTQVIHEAVVVLDYGSQYNLLIARRVRELGVRSVLLPPETPWEEVAQERPRGVILSGGPASVYDAGAPALPDWVVEKNLPVLGICYGMQLLAQRLGGKVAPGARREYGQSPLTVQQAGPLLSTVPSSTHCWMSHGDQVTQVPQGFEVLARSSHDVVAAMGDAGRRWFGLQFHPEVEHTPQGLQILKNFLDLSGFSFDWTPSNFIEETIERIREQTAGHRVVCALSGGVDSTVAAALVHRAVGDRLQCYFVDSGLLRAGERDQVAGMLAESTHLPVRVIDARARFLERLAGVTEPEKKRRMIGETFIRVFEQACIEEGAADFLVQGTLYPDVIESGPGKAEVIKSHHNVGGLPEDLRFKLVEPLRELFKDEVRRVGAELGVPGRILHQQPFPGPGLAVRILGEVTPDNVALLQKADAIVREVLEETGENRGLWQYFAVLLPVRTVGVMGDKRTYAQVVAIRAVTSSDGMTAAVPELSWKTLATISNRIINEVHGVNRVVYDLTTKPPGTIEWE
ncbi:MAG TPA: glutamine-hydrolyzing GMP synthase [Candidatus Xenobia bacterium]